MNRNKKLDRFHFNNNGIFHQNINSKIFIKGFSKVKKREKNLLNYTNIPVSQFFNQTVLVNRLQ